MSEQYKFTIIIFNVYALEWYLLNDVSITASSGGEY